MIPSSETRKFSPTNRTRKGDADDEAPALGGGGNLGGEEYAVISAERAAAVANVLEDEKPQDLLEDNRVRIATFTRTSTGASVLGKVGKIADASFDRDDCGRGGELPRHHSKDIKEDVASVERISEAIDSCSQPLTQSGAFAQPGPLSMDRAAATTPPIVPGLMQRLIEPIPAQQSSQEQESVVLQATLVDKEAEEDRIRQETREAMRQELVQTTTKAEFVPSEDGENDEPHRVSRSWILAALYLLTILVVVVVVVIVRSNLDNDSPNTDPGDGGMPDDLDDEPATSSGRVFQPGFQIDNDGPFECGETLGVYSTEDLAILFRSTFFSFLETDTILALQFGLVVRKICGSCADHPQSTICPPTAYGYNATHSGLLLVPLGVPPTSQNSSNPESTIKDGTSLLSVHFRGAVRTTQRVPSGVWPPSPLDGFDVFMGLFFSSSTGTYTILPDYQGFGESAETLYASTYVKQGYVTATWPLIQVAQKMVFDESDRTSAIADQLVLTGFGEGAYAAVANLDAFSRTTNLEVTKALIGEGPYRPSVQLLGSFESFMANAVDPDLRFMLVWFAIAFSSTTTDLNSFGSGNDLLDASKRNNVLAIAEAANSSNALNSLTTPENPFGFYNPMILNFLQNAVESNMTDPCRSMLLSNATDVFCAAMLEQDLVTTLETTQVDVTMYHGLDDELIPFSNLPNVSANPDYLTLSVVENGGYREASNSWMFGVMEIYEDPAQIASTPVDAKHLAQDDPCSRLRPGDVPVYLMNSDYPDQVVFYPLVGIDSDIKHLYVTDNAWSGTKFLDNEGTYRVSTKPKRFHRD